jgi:hypothetical protein
MALPLFEFLRRDAREPLSLVVSLDGSRAGAALLDSSSKKPVLRFCSDIELSAEETPTADVLLTTLLANLKLALREAKDKGLVAGTGNGKPAKIKGAMAYIGAPWCDTSIKRLCVAKETPMTLSQRILDRILERNDFALKLKGDLDEKVLARATANGYAVPSPVGLRARSFELTLFLAVVEPAVKAGVAAAVEEIFPGTKISFAAQSRALFDLTREMYPHEGQTLVLDVGGELIEACRLEGDDLGAVASAPVGVLSAVRSIAKQCKLAPAAAAAALRAHAESGAAECPEGVAKAVSDAAKAWGKAVQKTVLLVAGVEAPSRVVIAADQAMSAAARAVVLGMLPGAEVLPLSARSLEPMITADPATHPTTLACALSLHSRQAA